MASTTFAVKAGATAKASPLLAFSTTFQVRLGSAVGTGNVAWGRGTDALAKRVPWLPGVQVKPVREDGSWNPDVWRALNYLFNEVIGGINAPTIAQVTQTVTATQTQVLAVQASADSTLNYAAGIAATVQATAAVTQDSGLSGAESIPDLPSRPSRPGEVPL